MKFIYGYLKHNVHSSFIIHLSCIIHSSSKRRWGTMFLHPQSPAFAHTLHAHQLSFTLQDHQSKAIKAHLQNFTYKVHPPGWMNAINHQNFVSHLLVLQFPCFISSMEDKFFTRCRTSILVTLVWYFTLVLKSNEFIQLVSALMHLIFL